MAARRRPQSGEVGMSDNDSHKMNLIWAAVPQPPAGRALPVGMTVRDADVGSATFILDEASGFVASNGVHVKDS